MAMTDRLEKLGREDQVLFASIVKQIKSLVKDLDDSEKSSMALNSLNFQQTAKNNEKQLQLIYPVIKESCFEIQAAYSKQYEITFEIENFLMSSKVAVVSHELRSIISNIVQNAIDASLVGEKIIISAKDLTNRIEIKIQDFGKGIPISILDKVTEKNFTYAKENGSGLGLFHAKSLVEAWDGFLVVSSNEGIGTVITINLPISERTNWFTPRLKIKSDQTVIILDDQKSQHYVWEMKLNETDFNGPVKMFSSPNDFLDFKEKNINSDNLSKYIFFFDYDLGEGLPRGLDLLKSLPLNAQKHLVTGHFDDPQIQEICDQEKIYLISKTDLFDLPIVTASV